MRKDHPVSAVPALQEVTKHIRSLFCMSDTIYNNDCIYMYVAMVVMFARVLLYNGEFDLNCNFLGTLHTLEDNLWEGR